MAISEIPPGKHFSRHTGSISTLPGELVGTELNGANLRKVDLANRDLRGIDLNGADLSYARLNGTRLRDAQLRGANLTGANLCGADLSYANLSGANLRSASLKGASLRFAKLENSNLEGADLDGTDVQFACFINCQGLAESTIQQLKSQGGNVRSTHPSKRELRWWLQFVVVPLAVACLGSGGVVSLINSFRAETDPPPDVAPTLPVE